MIAAVIDAHRAIDVIMNALPDEAEIILYRMLQITIAGPLSSTRYSPDYINRLLLDRKGR
jgi:hypothetical protein